MNLVLIALLAAAITWIQCWIGGARLAFSLPAFGLLALASMLSLPGVRRQDRPAWLPCLAVSSALFLYMVFRAANSPVDYLWWPDFYTLIAAFSTYLLVALYLTDLVERAWIVALLLAIGCAECLVGLEQFVNADNFMAFGFIRPASGRRASGFFISPNSFAGYLDAVGVFGLSFGCWGRSSAWARGLFAYSGAVCYLGVGISVSRGGYLSAFASLVVFGCLSLWAVRRMAPHRLSGSLLLGAVTTAVLCLGASTMMGKSFLIEQRLGGLEKAFNDRDPEMRGYNWAAAIDQFHQSPIVGTGAGTYLYFGRMFRRPPLQADPVHAHSDYLELLAEYGAIGLVGALMLFGAHLASSLRTMADLIRNEWINPFTPKTNALALQIGSVASFAALAVHSALDFDLHIPANALVFAIVFGIMASSSASGEAHLASNAATLACRIALPLLGLSTCAFGLPKLPGETLAEKARVALRNHALQQSIDLGSRALAYERRNPEIYLNLGDADRSLADELPNPTLRLPFLRAAVDAYGAGLAIYPSDENLWVRLGQALDGLAEFREADVAYRRAEDLDPNLGILHAFHAAHLKACGRTEEAMQELKKGETLAQHDFTDLMNGAAAAAPDSKRLQR